MERIGNNRGARFAALGIRVAPADMLELDMFLGPGSMLTISEM